MSHLDDDRSLLTLRFLPSVTLRLSPILLSCDIDHVLLVLVLEKMWEFDIDLHMIRPSHFTPGLIWQMPRTM